MFDFGHPVLFYKYLYLYSSQLTMYFHDSRFSYNLV